MKHLLNSFAVFAAKRTPTIGWYPQVVAGKGFASCVPPVVCIAFLFAKLAASAKFSNWFLANQNTKRGSKRRPLPFLRRPAGCFAQRYPTPFSNRVGPRAARRVTFDRVIKEQGRTTVHGRTYRFGRQFSRTRIGHPLKTAFPHWHRRIQSLCASE